MARSKSDSIFKPKIDQISNRNEGADKLAYQLSTVPDYELNNSSVSKKVHGWSFRSRFGSLQIEKSPDCFTVICPVTHRLRNNSCLNLFKKDQPPEHFLNEVSSHLRLRFTREEEKKWFLSVSCQAYPDIFNYDLNPVVSLLLKVTSEFKNLMRYPDCSVVDNTEPLPDTHNFNLRQVVIFSEENTLELQKVLRVVSDFNVNCLKRFEELTYRREMDAYKNSQELGCILHQVVTDPCSLSLAEYRAALVRLKMVEQNETFQNDPQIRLSLTHVKDALIYLSAIAQERIKGVQLDEEHIHRFFDELSAHEGNKPGKDIWFPHGTVARIKMDLTDNFSLSQSLIQNIC